MSEQVMKSIYYDPANPGAYVGREGLKRAYLEKTGEILKNGEADDWLLAQDTYTLHRPVAIHFKRNRVIVHDINSQFQLDLVDMSAYSVENDNMKFMLTCIDVLSKYAWIRVLRNKSAIEVKRAFEDILKEGRTPQKVQTDKGKEFFNSHFEMLMKKYNIKHFATGNYVKASIVERFNKTIKSRMWRYLTAANTHRYVEVIQDLVRGYNHSYHRSIKMKPADVCEENVRLVLKNLYGTTLTRNGNQSYKFQVGDTVRLSKLRGAFTKGYEKGYTDEYFTITECIPRVPPVYRIKDYDGDVIVGTFYEQELLKIIVAKDKTFKVEAVLNEKVQKGRKMCLVKWLGWPEKFNSWIPSEQVVDLETG